MKNRIRSQKTLLIGLLVIVALAVLIISITGLSIPKHQTNILISEVLSSNTDAVADEDGEYPDFVELYNAGESDVNLHGWYLSDNSNDPLRWTLPSIILKPSEYIYFFASGKDKQQSDGIYHTNFSIAADGSEQIILTTPDGGAHCHIGPLETIRNVSYGIAEGFTTPVYMTMPTPGTANKAPFYDDIISIVPRYEALVITEYMTRNDAFFPDADGVFHDWVEIHNLSSEEVSLRGWHLSDNEANLKKWRFPNDAVIPSGGYIALHCSGRSASGHVAFSLSETDRWLLLTNNDGIIVDTIPLYDTRMYASYGRIVSDDTNNMQAGHEGFFAVPTPGAANEGVPLPSPEELPWDIPTVLIMEYMSDNDYYTDEDGDFSDWVELYNYGSETVGMSGMQLSDSAANPSQWRFQDGAELLPGERMLIWLSGKFKAGHASFSISGGDEGLYLSDRYGRIIDSAVIIDLTGHVSAGRDENDFSKWYFYPRATPGSANDTIGFTELAGAATAGWEERNASEMPVESETAISNALPVQTNVDDIIVREGELISLRTDEPDASIRYTLDGSVPTQASRLYETPIEIKGNTVLRARAYAPDKPGSDVLSRTYLIGVSHDIPIATLATDPAGMFSHEWGIYADGPGWGGEKPYLGANYYMNVEREAHFAFYEDGRLGIETDVGIKIHGGWSRMRPQKSLKVFFRGKYGLSNVAYPFIPDIDRTVFDAFILHNAGGDWGMAMLRDSFIYESMADVTNIIGMAASPVAVYINGEYFGLHFVREKLNADYFAINEGIPDDEIDIIREDSLKTGSYAEFGEMRRKILSMDRRSDEAYDYIDANIDLDNWIDYWIIVTYFHNYDIQGNIECYKQRGEGHKWRWILYDQDASLWLPNVSKNRLDVIYAGSSGGVGGLNFQILPKALLQNEKIKDRFIERYAELMRTALDTDRLFGILEQCEREIENEMPMHIARWKVPYSMETWRRNVDGIRNFLTRRPDHVKQHLQSTFNLSSERMNELFPDI